MDAAPFAAATKLSNCTGTPFDSAITNFSNFPGLFTPARGRAPECGTIPSMAEASSAEPGGRIRSEARGPHWVAWVADANGKPVNSVVLVGETQEEAEERARKWAAQR